MNGGPDGSFQPLETLEGYPEEAGAYEEHEEEGRQVGHALVCHGVWGTARGEEDRSGGDTDQ